MGIRSTIQSITNKRNSDACQAGATVERTLADTGHAVAYHDAC